MLSENVQFKTTGNHNAETIMMIPIDSFSDNQIRKKVDFVRSYFLQYLIELIEIISRWILEAKYFDTLLYNRENVFSLPRYVFTGMRTDNDLLKSDLTQV